MTTRKGLVVWLYGLSGAGKSTLCNTVAKQLRARSHRVQVLDADQIRQHLCADLGFGKQDRIENIRRICYVAKLLAHADLIVVVAAITPFAAMRDFLKANLESLLDVFVDAPLEICETRDPKGLYKRSRDGVLHEFTGIDSPFDIPESPDVVCHTDCEEIDESSQKIVDAVVGRLAEIL